MRETIWMRNSAAILAVAAAGLRLAFNYLRLFNFGWVGGVGLFGGSRLKSWQAFVLPLGLMIGSDLVLALAHGSADYGLLHPTRPWVYGSYLVYVLIGRHMIGDSRSPVVIGGAAVLGSIQFFLITNFGSWLEPILGYSQDLAGLMSCYMMGLPFFANTLIGDLVSASALFALHEFVRGDWRPARAQAETVKDR